MLETNKDNPYYQWIDLYGDHDFKEATAQAIAIINDIASSLNPQQIQAMQQAFIYSVKFEWLFWHSAYQQEGWLV